MWLYHVPFTICVVSVLKIAFCDQKKSLTIISTYYFFSSILRFLTKGVGKKKIAAAPYFLRKFFFNLPPNLSFQACQ
jgi:hypothetical protein